MQEDEKIHRLACDHPSIFEDLVRTSETLRGINALSQTLQADDDTVWDKVDSQLYQRNCVGNVECLRN
jgi:hypothetical protein